MNRKLLLVAGLMGVCFLLGGLLLAPVFAVLPTTVDVGTSSGADITTRYLGVTRIDFNSTNNVGAITWTGTNITEWGSAGFTQKGNVTFSGANRNLLGTYGLRGTVTIYSPTLSGTVAGTPTISSAWTWSTAQTFPTLSKVGNIILSHTGLTAERTFTFPDATDSVVTLGATQTLTAKTLTSPDINGGTADLLTSLTIANAVDVGNFDVRALSFTADSLTSSRVPFASTNGLLVDDADLTFVTDTLTATKIAGTTLTGNILGADGTISFFTSTARGNNAFFSGTVNATTAVVSNAIRPSTSSTITTSTSSFIWDFSAAGDTTTIRKGGLNAISLTEAGGAVTINFNSRAVSGLAVDTIAEGTTGTGVTADSVLLKDGGVRLADAGSVAWTTDTKIYRSGTRLLTFNGTSAIVVFDLANAVIRGDADNVLDLGSAAKRIRYISVGSLGIQVIASVSDANAVSLLDSTGLQFGAGGGTALDTNLYRSAANVLKTDDALTVSGALNTKNITVAAHNTYYVGVTGTRFKDGWFVDLHVTNGVTTGHINLIGNGATYSLVEQSVLDGAKGNRGVWFIDKTIGTGKDGNIVLPQSYNKIFGFDSTGAYWNSQRLITQDEYSKRIGELEQKIVALTESIRRLEK